MNRVQVAPGAFVSTLPGEKFKRCKIALHLVLPSRRDTATALAVLPSVLERRCEAIPDPTALARRLFDLYGADLSADSYTVGANRVLTVGVSGLKNEYALAGEDLAGEYLKLACELLFAPKLEGGAFASEDVEIEKAKQADYLKSEMNDKRSYCMRQARRKLFSDSPLGIEAAGYLEEISAITPQSLYDAYRDLLADAQLEVVVCGADGGKAAEALAGRLAGLRRAPAVPARLPLFEGTGELLRYSEAMDTAQGKLCILFPSTLKPGPRTESVMRVANAVLGGLPTSRLFMNVREKQSLCYYCSSSYGSFSGVLSIDSGVDHAMAKRAGEAILHEVEQLQQRPVEKQELEAAHRALHNVFTAAADSPDALANWAFMERMRGTDLTLDEVKAQVAAVSAAEVREALAAFSPGVEYLITGKEGA